jgi:hypothetical protein
MFILRANQIYTQRGKPGRLPVGKSFFYEEIEPRLEKVQLGPRCCGYTNRSLDKLIEEGIAQAATGPGTKPRQRAKGGAFVGRPPSDATAREVA